MFFGSQFLVSNPMQGSIHACTRTCPCHKFFFFFLTEELKCNSKSRECAESTFWSYCSTYFKIMNWFLLLLLQNNECGHGYYVVMYATISHFLYLKGFIFWLNNRTHLQEENSSIKASRSLVYEGIKIRFFFSAIHMLLFSPNWKSKEYNK